MAFSDPSTEISNTILDLDLDVLNMISPGGIVVAKTGAHTHTIDLVKNTPTYKQAHL